MLVNILIISIYMNKNFIYYYFLKIMKFYKINTLDLQTLLFFLIFSYSAVKTGNLKHINLINQNTNSHKITHFTSTQDYNKLNNGDLFYGF